MSNVYCHETAMQDVVSETNKVMSSKSSNAAKSSKLRALGTNANKEMTFVYSNLNTLSNKLSAMRNAIADECPRHHMFNKKIDELRDESPWLKQNLMISSSTKPKTISATIRDVRKRAKDIALKRDEEKNFNKRDEFLAISNALKQIKVFSETYYHLKLDDAKNEQLKSNREQRIEHQMTHQKTLGKVQLIELTKRLLNSKSHYELAMGIALATGRRASEIYYSAKFKVAGEYKIEFTGQLKKKFWQGDKEIPYFFYTTVPAIEVKEAFDRFRAFEIVREVSEKVKETNKVALINQKFSAGCSRVAKGALGAFDNSYSFKFSDTRAIWARMVFDTHFKDDEWKECSEEKFWQCMLGHESTTTQHDYKRFRLVQSKALDRAITKKDEVITMEVLMKADEEVIESADYERLGFKPHLLTNAHSKTKDYLKEYGSFRYQKSLFYLTAKRGGIGLTKYVADAYLAILTKYI